jgi:uncharacterized membrane protein YdjX (TVP38/TMEM64 family)
MDPAADTHKERTISINNNKDTIQKRRPTWLYPIAALVAVYFLAKSTGLLDNVNPEYLRTEISRWGAYGVVLYFVLFSLGQLVYLPGIIFVATAALAYGQWLGFLYALIGASLAASLSFFVVRFLGGTPLASTSTPWVNKLMGRIHIRPFSSVLVMRTLFASAPWLNYMLAMSAIRYRDYILGSVLGFIPQLILATYFTDWFVSRM